MSMPSSLSWVVNQRLHVLSLFRAKPAGKSVPAGTITIGKADEPLRALAFAGGGFDATIQLGVAHALLVAECQAPHVVVGISAGAVNAVALAEVLQAGHGKQNAQREAQVAKLREILEASREAPGELLAGLLPDPYEVNARSPLKPLELPIHYKRERREREEVVNARYGMIRLLNGILSIRLTLGTITRFIRRILELQSLAECKSFPKRCWGIARETAGLTLLVAANLFHLAPPVGRILWGIMWAGRYRALAKRIEKSHLMGNFSPLRQLWEEFVTAFLKWSLKAAGLLAQETAKKIIFKRVSNWVRAGVETGVGLVFLIVVLVVILAPALECWWGWKSGWPYYYRGIPLLAYPLVAMVVAARSNRSPIHDKSRLGRWAMKRFLASYDLQKDLATPYLLKPLFVRLFDREYYGPLNLSEVVDKALRDDTGGIESQTSDGATNRQTSAPKSGNDADGPKTLRGYCAGKEPIYVAPVAANVATGRLEALPVDLRVVDSLLAATAVVPFFRAHEVEQETERKTGEGADRNGGPKTEKKYFIDGINVANEPTYALMDLLLSLGDPAKQAELKVRIDQNVSDVEVYPVSPFPLSTSDANPPKNKLSGIVDIAQCAMELQRFQDARLERRMVQLYRDTLPPGKGLVKLPDSQTGKPRRFVRGTLYPIEPAQALRLNERVLAAHDRDERRRLIDEAVADGCRATLQVILADTIKKVGGAKAGMSVTIPVPCRAVIAARQGVKEEQAGLPGHAPYEPGKIVGPGIAEICSRCTICREVDGSATQSLVVSTPQSSKGDWPRHGETAGARPVAEAGEEPDGSTPAANEDANGWPQDRGTMPGHERPTITFLYSGGVFRGVFQVGWSMH